VMAGMRETRARFVRARQEQGLMWAARMEDGSAKRYLEGTMECWRNGPPRHPRNEDAWRRWGERRRLSKSSQDSLQSRGHGKYRWVEVVLSSMRS
jgi:hypothetical protein